MTIILKDGTAIENATVGRNGFMLELKMSIADGTANIAKFMDRTVMSKVQFISGEYIYIYKGFDRFMYFELDSGRENIVNIWMRGLEGEVSEETKDRFPEMYMPKGD